MIGVVIGNGFVYSTPYSTSPIGINLHCPLIMLMIIQTEGLVGMCMVVILRTVYVENIVKFLKSCTTTLFMVFSVTCTICKGPKLDA